MKRKASILTLTLALLLLTAVMTQLARLVGANPYIRDQQFKEVAPPAGIDPLVMSVLTPKNNTMYNSSDVALVFDVFFRDYYPSKVYYNASWQSNSSRQLDFSNATVIPSTLINERNFEFSIKMEGISEGPQWLEVYAVGEAFSYTGYEIKGSLNLIEYFDFYKVVGSSKVNFTIDTTPPNISVLSVKNKTYYTSDIPLNFTVNEAPSQITYVLDGQENVTIAGNTTLSGLAEGAHNVTIYALDVAGNIGSSKTIYFSISEPEPFGTIFGATASGVSIAIVSVGLLVYFKRRKVDALKRRTLASIFVSILFLSAAAGTQFASFGKADPYEYTGDVPPKPDTIPPQISILSPSNRTIYTVNHFSLIFGVRAPTGPTVSYPFVREIHYKTDWQQNNITVYDSGNDYNGEYAEFSSELNLTGIPEGNHSITVTAVYRGMYIPGNDPHTLSYSVFSISGSSVVNFTIDTTTPNIIILSIGNRTYNTRDIALNFTVDEPVSFVTCNIDGQIKVLIKGNATLTDLAYGEHNVTVFARDSAGHVGASETVYFTIAKETEPEPFPTLVIAAEASLVVACTGLLVYLKKHGKR